MTGHRRPAGLGCTASPQLAAAPVGADVAPTDRKARSPIALIPGAWAERALCAQADPDAWFPDKGRRDLTSLAKRICAACPVRGQCLDYALSGADTWQGISTGIWGGLTSHERAELRRRRASNAAAA